jgi:hypothetical protein
MSLTTPNIGAALATSIQFVSGSFIYGTSATRIVEFISQSGSAVNFIALSSANTATAPLIQASGSDTNVTLELAGQGNGGVLVQGESSGTAIPGGYVGQIILGSSLGPTSFTTTNTPQNFTNLPIPAGVWLVMFTASVTNSSVQTGPTTLSLSTTSATLEGNVGFGNAESNSPVASLFYNLAQSLYINISSTTTYFLVGNSIWTGTAPTLFYQMQAIRIA